MRREKECLINITGSAAGCKMLRTVATDSGHRIKAQFTLTVPFSMEEKNMVLRSQEAGWD